MHFMKGKALCRRSGPKALLNLRKLEMFNLHGSQTIGAKVDSQEGNSPDQRLRSLIKV